MSISKELRPGQFANIFDKESGIRFELRVPTPTQAKEFNIDPTEGMIFGVIEKDQNPKKTDYIISSTEEAAQVFKKLVGPDRQTSLQGLMDGYDLLKRKNV